MPLKQSILATLSSTAPQVGPGAAQCVSAVAAVELPKGRWQDLIPQLIQFAQNQENTALRVHTLQTIGYICEVIVSHIEKEVGLG
jgi:importin subunit beta-1